MAQWKHIFSMVVVFGSNNTLISHSKFHIFAIWDPMWYKLIILVISYPYISVLLFDI